MPASVTLPLEELDTLKQSIADRDREIVKLKTELIAAKSGSSTVDVTEINRRYRAACEVIGFAMSNLSPEITKRWPFDRLREVALGLTQLIDFNCFDNDLANEMQKFATECEVWEFRRKTVPEAYVPPPPGFSDSGAPSLPVGATLPAMEPIKVAVETQSVLENNQGVDSSTESKP